ncbi:MAG: energy transducer TonB, partial [Alphaproteobacteria bacterium]|nr:energy transducer TonB [Alphaproteobacteria bacterium]
MRKGAAFSAALHASLVAIAIVGLPSWWKPKPIELETVTVEVVSAIEKEPAPPRAMPEPPRPEPPRPEPSR